VIFPASRGGNRGSYDLLVILPIWSWVWAELAAVPVYAMIDPASDFGWEDCQEMGSDSAVTNLRG
jgi:hypothetical protein